MCVLVCYPLQVYGEVLHLPLQPLLDLLQAGSSGLGRLCCLLGLLETHCKFAPGEEWVDGEKEIEKSILTTSMFHS